jgi:hypothetical protein
MRRCRKLPAVPTAVVGAEPLPRLLPPVKEIGMPIDPAVLARNISALAGLDAERDLGRAMQQITSAAKALLRVDGAGLMLADERGQLRWATASD